MNSRLCRYTITVALRRWKVCRALLPNDLVTSQSEFVGVPDYLLISARQLGGVTKAGRHVSYAVTLAAAPRGLSG